MERFSFIFLVAGLIFFAIAFAVSAYLPMLPVQNLEVRTVAQLAEHPPLTFLELKEQYPGAYRKAFFSKTDEQALSEWQARSPQVFARVFSKTDEEALTWLKASAPAMFEKVFPDMDLDDALGELDDDRDGKLAEIKTADPGAYAIAFETTVAGAMAALHDDYALTLLRIRRADPDAYQTIFEERPDHEVFAEALQLGLKTYIGEGCWHCHSQQVRPWGNDEARYGQVSYPEEYHNDMNYPPLWGTRRIGPDLIRRGGMLSNDWHVAHFANPRDTTPVSVMPRYPWFFEGDGKTPNKTGLSIIAYVQWLGSWQNSRKESVYGIAEIEHQYPSVRPPAAGGEP